MSDKPAPNQLAAPAWLAALTLLLSMFWPAPAPEPLPPPTPVVVTVDPTPKPVPKPIDWIAIIKTLVEVVPKIEPPEAPPADPGLLGVAIHYEPGMAELRASGKFTEIRWNRTDIRTYENDRVAVLVAPPGDYEFVVAASAIIDGKLELDQQTIHVAIAGPRPPPVVVDPNKPPPVVTPPSDPTTKATRLTYVYEQRQGPIPAPVAAALSKLNVPGGFVASSIDQHAISGKGQVPAQYAVALEAAKKAGIPCLVVQAGDAVLKVVPRPTTAADVEGAVK